MKITILGASSGFGREFTKLLADDSNEITAISNDISGLETLKEDILNDYNCEIETVCRDLTIDDDLDYVCEHYTDCDFLINSAGGGKLGNITSHSIEEDQYFMKLNMWALHKITKTTLLKMIKKKQGNLINVCSSSSFTPLPNFSLYAATKAFSGSYTLALAKEVDKYSIRVMAMCPGPTRTNFLSQEHYNAIKKRYGNIPIFMEADVVAQNTLKKSNKGGILYIPGVMNKMNYWFDKLAPRKLSNNVIHRMLDSLDELG